MLWTLGGVVVGASVVALLTPKTGTQLRGLVRELFKRGREDSLDPQLEAMENEGGVSHVVPPPTPAREDARAH